MTAIWSGQPPVLTYGYVQYKIKS